MTRVELLASEYAFTQCDDGCQYRQPSCHETCGEFNICMIDYKAGYEACKNETAKNRNVGKEMQVGNPITIEAVQYIAVKAVQFSCEGCAFYKFGKPCGQEDFIIALCLGGNIIFKTV